METGLASDRPLQVDLLGGILIAVAGGGVGLGARRFLNFHRPSEVGSLGRTLFSGFFGVGLCTRLRLRRMDGLKPIPTSPYPSAKVPVIFCGLCGSRG